MYFAVDSKGKRVYIDKADSSFTYFCPVCGAELSIKRGTMKAHHFAHHPSVSACADNWHYDMSEWHRSWQSKFPLDAQEVVMKGGETHRADVFLAKRKTVIEFQHSRLSFEEFQKRNIFYSSFGYKVVWVFHMASVFESGNMDYLDMNTCTKFKWASPFQTFNSFNPSREGDVSLYFQVFDDMESDDCSLIHVTWAAPSGFRRFCGEMLSENEFLSAYGESQILCADDTPAAARELYDNLISCRGVDGYDFWHGCVDKEDYIVSEEECNYCPYRASFVQGGCVKRFHDMIDGHVKRIVKDDYGRVVSVVLQDHCGENVTCKFSAIPSPGRRLDELWDELENVRVARFRNLLSGYEVQLTDSPSIMAKKYRGRIYGKIKFPSAEQYGKDSREVYCWDRAEWVLTWFARKE